MARAALSRRAMCGNPSRAMPVVRRLGGPLMARTDPLDGPFRRAKNGLSQMRRPESAAMQLHG